MKDTEFLSVQIPKRVKAFLKTEAEKLGVSMSGVIRFVLLKHVDRKSKKGEPK